MRRGGGTPGLVFICLLLRYTLVAEYCNEKGRRYALSSVYMSIVEVHPGG